MRENACFFRQRESVCSASIWQWLHVCIVTQFQRDLRKQFTTRNAYIYKRHWMSILLYRSISCWYMGSTTQICYSCISASMVPKQHVYFAKHVTFNSTFTTPPNPPLQQLQLQLQPLFFLSTTTTLAAFCHSPPNLTEVLAICPSPPISDGGVSLLPLPPLPPPSPNLTEVLAFCPWPPIWRWC